VFATEKDARRYLEMVLADDFHLLPEVQMEHTADGSRLRIDYLAAPRKPGLLPNGTDLIGIEVKRGYGSFRDFDAAFYQCVGYRDCRITDGRAPRKQGQRLPFVFLFPAMERPGVEEVAGSTYPCMADGVYRAAGKFSVGFIHVRLPFWSPTSSEVQQEALTQLPTEVQFRVSADPFWSRRLNYGGFTWATTRQYVTDKKRGSI
jgi:hypothetical protein